MPTLNRFEELKIWQLAREFAKQIYELSKIGSFAKDFELKNQILASSGSVMDNIAEGFEREGNKEFIHFLHIAKGSLGEAQSQLYRALDREYITQKSLDELLASSNVLAASIKSFINYLKNSDIRGNKFKTDN